MEVQYIRLRFHREGRDDVAYEWMGIEQEQSLAKMLSDLCNRKGYDLAVPPKMVGREGEYIHYRYAIAPLYVGDGSLEI